VTAALQPTWTERWWHAAKPTLVTGVTLGLPLVWACLFTSGAAALPMVAIGWPVAVVSQRRRGASTAMALLGTLAATVLAILVGVATAYGFFAALCGGDGSGCLS
jgi:ABC-type Fe3+ transport system permease subunit